MAPGERYLHNWHIEAIAHHLEECLRGSIKRLIITLPPRSLKSICASVAFPAFALGHDPTLRIVCASYSEELAARHGRDCRTVMQSGWYPSVFPGTRLNRQKAGELEFETTAGGGRFATSVGGTLTGLGGDIFIIDDANKAADANSGPRLELAKQWFDSTLYSRLNSKVDGVIIVIMQRVHVDDLVGYLLEKPGEPWIHLNLPAIAEAPQDVPLGRGRLYRRVTGEVLHTAREPREALDRARSTMGSFAFSAQYQQQPVPPEGMLIRKDWLTFFDALPAREPGDQIVQSWDTATKADQTNDYSVCTTWHVKGETYYLIDVLRRRIEFPELLRLVPAHAKQFKADVVLIEDSASGSPLIQALRHDHSLHPLAVKPKGDKVERMQIPTFKIETGAATFWRSAAWTDDFIAELLQFPHGRHDDQVDSLSQALNWLHNRPSPIVFIDFPDLKKESIYDAFGGGWDPHWRSRI
ncbi:MAG: phage terminase large subunit [Vicinamibacterales bacterium]